MNVLGCEKVNGESGEFGPNCSGPNRMVITLKVDAPWSKVAGRNKLVRNIRKCGRSKSGRSKNNEVGSRSVKVYFNVRSSTLSPLDRPVNPFLETNLDSVFQIGNSLIAISFDFKPLTSLKLYPHLECHFCFS